MSGTRFLGDTAHGGRLYVVPAEHMLAARLGPPRCLSHLQRVIEQESLSLLHTQYRQRALCLVLLYGNNRPHNCAPVVGNPYALLYARGTPAYGLVPNGVSAVTVTYQTAPPRTVRVHRNLFVIVAPSQKSGPVRCRVARRDRKRSEGSLRLLLSGGAEAGASRVSRVRRRQAVGAALAGQRAGGDDHLWESREREVCLVDRPPDLARGWSGRRSVWSLRGAGGFAFLDAAN